MGFCSRRAIISILGLTEMVQAWVQPIASAVVAVALVCAWHLIFIAPYRALRMIRPFSVEVATGHIETLYPPCRFEPQKAALLITNKSYLTRSACVMHIMCVDAAS